MSKFCLILILASTQQLPAQRLAGKVVDGETQRPLHGAYVRCTETGEGGITDDNGNFKLFFENKETSRTIVVSYVGYQNATKRLDQSDSFFTFELLSDTTVLHEVVVSSPDPSALIQAAIGKIPENHGGQRLLTFFYRMETKDKDKFIQVSEACFQLNQLPPTRNQLKIIKARETEDEWAFNGVGMGVGTRASVARNSDVTINPEESFLSQDNLKKHDFFLEGVTTRNGEEVYEISFDQKPSHKALFKGRIFLHTESLAFVEVEYGLSPKGIAYFHYGNLAERTASKLLDIQIRVRSHQEKISYRPFHGKWYLNHIVIRENVDVYSRRFKFDVAVRDQAEFLVTQIDTTSMPPFDEKAQAKNEMLEAAADSTTTFWKNYNTIPAKIDYRVIAQEIESRNEYSKAKLAVEEKLKHDWKKEPALADSILTFYHHKGFFNGTTLVKHKGKIILHKGYGFADKERQVKNDTCTVFRIGSISKTFTSNIIWQLKEEGLLNYEDSVQRFLPWYPYRGITVHHLLTHSSGIPNYMSNGNFLDSIQHPFTKEELIKHFGLDSPRFAPGSQFQYSNTGFTLLAIIAEKASGKSFDVLFDEKVIKKFNLSHTIYARPAQVCQAKGYLGTMPEPTYPLGNAAGCGAISTTASDLLKWDDAHDDPRMKELFQPRTWYADWGAFYGYGWNIDKHQFRVSKKSTIQYHGGTDLGFKSMMARQPEEDTLVVLLNNTGDFPLFDITDLLLTAIK